LALDIIAFCAIPVADHAKIFWAPGRASPGSDSDENIPAAARRTSVKKILGWGARLDRLALHPGSS